MIGLLKGLQATIGHLFTRKVTVQYPEERRELPERSRGLIRTRLKPQTDDPRCVSCTFCEQICPAVAIKVIYNDGQPEKVWTLDAGAGPMLASFSRGDDALGLEEWPGGGEAAPGRDGCLASSLLDAGELSSLSLARTARSSGTWLSQVYGVATFYDQLGAGAAATAAEPGMPAFRGAAGDFPPMLTGSLDAIDPEKIDTYMAAGGYRGVTEALAGMEPEEVADEVAISGLRGRGGSGFPTGSKWRQVLKADAPLKYVICNGHEGDPGSCKDRFLLENSPHSVIEGMIAAAYAVGATEGIIYLSAENRTAAERIRTAVRQAEEQGLLSSGTQPGGGLAFSVRVVTVPEAYVGGEETALIAALAGERPMPTVRPPYPGESGLNGLPTLIENAETLAAIPWILNNGARAFQKTGAPNAPGTKLYNLMGAVKSPGLYEATLDITIKKLVEGYAGGFTRKVKAALVGSVCGGFLTPGLFDIPLDYDSLAEAGGNLSAGTINILDGGACVVDTVRQGLAFTAKESCGKCVPGRMGTWRLHDILERICSGKGAAADLELAADLAADTADGALCFLGRGAVRPLLTALEFFRQEFEEHIGEKKRCAAGRCRLK